MEFKNPYFGVVDYSVFTGGLLISIGIGVYVSFKGKNSPEDFLLGNRSFGAVPVAMSLLTSFVSSITLLGYGGEVYRYGIQIAIILIGASMGTYVMKFITLPVMHPLKLMSNNEYIELRFKSNSLRLTVMFLFMIQGLLYMGFCLYAPTLALTSVMPISTSTCIYLLGGICTLYSTIGGIKAVVWTDVFQLIVLLLGLVVVLTIGVLNVGGLVKTWSIASEGGRLELINFNFSIYERHTFFNLLFFGFYFFSSFFGISQISTQRISSIESLENAKKVYGYNVVGLFVIYSMVFTSGLMSYATYKDCDPLTSGKIKKADQILSFFVADKLSHIWGLSGLFAATITAGTLSSLSSVISSMVAQLWKDIFLQFKYFKNISPNSATKINKALSLFIGIIMIGMALLASNSRSLAQASLTVTGASVGPAFGVFMLGMLFPRCNLKGAWAGLLLSIVLTFWITIGSFQYGTIVPELPFSVAGCSSNITSISLHHAKNITEPHSEDIYLSLQDVTQFTDNQTVISEEFLNDDKSFPLMWLYNISYTYTPVIGPVFCILTGLLISLITGPEQLTNVSPEHISPFVRKWYWKTYDESYHSNYQVDVSSTKL